jgi:hypothetical protein
MKLFIGFLAVLSLYATHSYSADAVPPTWVNLGEDDRATWYMFSETRKSEELLLVKVKQVMKAPITNKLGGKSVSGITGIVQTAAIDCNQRLYVFPESSFFASDGSRLYFTSAPKDRWHEKIRSWPAGTFMEALLGNICKHP